MLCAFTAICYLHYLSSWNDNCEILSIRILFSAIMAATIGYASYKYRDHLLIGQKEFIFLFIASATLILTCNHRLYIYWHQFPICIMFTMAMLALSFSLLRFHAIIIWLPIVSIEAMRSVCFWKFGIEINSQAISAILAASNSEIVGFATFENICIIILILAASFSLLYSLNNILKRSKSLPLFTFGIFMASIALLIRSTAFPVQLCDQSNAWPVLSISSLANSASSSTKNTEKILSIVSALPSPTCEKTSISTIDGKEGVVCILHIGESVRADRLSLNGYKNDTTPWLRTQTRLTNYPTCISSAPETIKAFTTILTNGRYNIEYAPDKRYLPSVGSIVDLFSANGFACAAFWGSNDRALITDTPFSLVKRKLTMNCKWTINRGDSHGQILQIHNYIRETDSTNQFILINNAGSHMPFYDYDTKAPAFTPTDPMAFYRSPMTNPSDAEKANNAYDNTIHHTDDFIRKLLSGLEGKPYIYIYVGDHGEYIGQDGNKWMRSALEHPDDYYNTQGCMVPLLFIVSPEMEKLNPHFANAVAQLKEHSQMVTAHEHIFHTLLGFFGIKTPFYDSSLDLTSPDAKPYTGPQPQNNGKPLEDNWH